MIASTFLSKRFSNFCSKSKTGDDCRVCRKSFAPEEASRICCECQHKVCEDCACYSTTTNSDDPVSVSLSLFVHLVHLIICRNNSFHLFKILPHAVFQRISLKFSPMKPRRILSLFDIQLQEFRVSKRLESLYFCVVVCFSKRWIFFRETERDLERETNVYYIKYYTNYISLYKNNWCNSFIEETRNTRGADYAEVDWLDSYARLLRRLILFHKGHCQRRPLPHICLIKGNEETLFTGNGGESFFLYFSKVCVCPPLLFKRTKRMIKSILSFFREI